MFLINCGLRCFALAQINKKASRSGDARKICPGKGREKAPLGFPSLGLGELEETKLVAVSSNLLNCDSSKPSSGSLLVVHTSMIYLI
jgi:hypothetical protein